MTPSFKIAPGRRFFFDGDAITFVRNARDQDGTLVFVRDDGVPVSMSVDEVRDYREHNRLVDDVPPRVAVEGGAPVARRAWVTFDRANEKEKLCAARMLDYVFEWQETKPPRSIRGLLPLIARVHARRTAAAHAKREGEPPPPSVSRLQQVLRAFLQGGARADAVIPQNRNKGNFRSKLPPVLAELIADHLDRLYLQRQGPEIAEVHRAIVKAVAAVNAKRSTSQWLSTPSYTAVLAASKELCAFTVDYCRKGPAFAREKWRGIAAGYLTTCANEVWEIDDTRVDLICVHEDGTTVIGRPWLTLVIDRHTRMIMSFVISFSPPDTQIALEAMRLAIHGKADWIAAHPKLQGSWPASGCPEAVHVDNGRHYNSAALKLGLMKLGIAHRTLPVLKAWYKGIVERALGTISRQVFHTEPGTTYSGIYERDRENTPETVAVTTVPELREKLLMWIVEQYQHRRHKGIEDTPYNAWHQSIREFPLCLPPTREQIDAALSMTVARTLRKDCLEVHGLQYASEHLVRLRMVPRADRVKEVVVRVDPRDLTVVHFLDATTDPAKEQWHPAFLKNQLRQVEGRTLDEYLLARAFRRANAEVYGDNDPDFVATYEKLEENRRKAEGDKRLGPRTRAAGERERLIARAARATDPAADPSVDPGPGLDLNSLINAGASNLAAPSTSSAPEEPTPHSIDPATHAAKHGLRVRVRHAKKDEN